mmetsp:Transcript_12628/g.14951  ORF Transcript_12628/g.14951 Transcript_12628/m.14951 type:complete len:186 (-) Transcript_12628:98-655(-)
MCRDFLNGKCTRGQFCRFMHEERGVDVCKDFQKGRCMRGSECKFRHESIDGGAVRSRYGGDANAGSMVPICKDFQNGRCARGNACKYLHEMGEQKQEAQAQAPQTCRDFLLGRCFRPNCKYLHDASQRLDQNDGSNNQPASSDRGGYLPPESSDQGGYLQPCRDFQRGRCVRGNMCKFSHDAAIY